MGPTARPILRIGLALLVVSLFYAALFLCPEAAGPGKEPEIRVKPKLSPERAGELVALTRSLFGRGEYREALAPGLLLYEAFPENHIYIEQVAAIYGHLHRYKEEAEFWEKYLQQSPVPVEGCPQIGLAYQKQGRQDESLRAFERCLLLEPRNPDLLFYLAHALELTQQFDKAAELYKKGVSLVPENLDLRNGLARVLLREGKTGMAKQAAAQVLRASPGNSDALLILGLACSREGNRNNARKYLERGLTIAESYPDFHLALASLAEQDGDFRRALLHYDRALELEPGNRDTARLREALGKRRP